MPGVSYLHTTLQWSIRNHLIFVNKFNSDLHSYKHKENEIKTKNGIGYISLYFEIKCLDLSSLTE